MGISFRLDAKQVFGSFIVLTWLTFVGNFCFPVLGWQSALAGGIEQQKEIQSDSPTINDAEKKVKEQISNMLGLQKVKSNKSKMNKVEKYRYNINDVKVARKRTGFVKKVKKQHINKIQTVQHMSAIAKNSSEILYEKREFMERKLNSTNKKKVDNVLKEQTGNSAIIALVGKLLGNMADRARIGKEATNRGAICGLSTSNIPFVILSSGEKIFEGGKLRDGCIVENIEQNYIILNCNGLKRKQIL